MGTYADGIFYWKTIEQPNKRRGWVDADFAVDLDTDALTKGLPTTTFLKHKVEMLGVGMKVYSACVSSFMIYKCHIC
jgi:hypothetical protein